MKERTKIIIAMTLMVCLGMAIGYSAGFLSGLNWIITRGVRIMSENGVDLKLTSEQISNLINHYLSELNNHNGSGSMYADTILK